MAHAACLRRSGLLRLLDTLTTEPLTEREGPHRGEDERQLLRVDNVFAALAAPGASRRNRPVVDEERRYVCGVRPDRPRADGSPVGGGA